MKRELILGIIDRKIKEEYPTPDHKGNGDLFVLRAYNYYWIKQFRNFIRSYPVNSDMFSTIEEYLYMLDHMSTCAKDSKKSFHYSTGYDVITDILDAALYHSMEEIPF